MSDACYTDLQHMRCTASCGSQTVPVAAFLPSFKQMLLLCCCPKSCCCLEQQIIVTLNPNVLIGGSPVSYMLHASLNIMHTSFAGKCELSISVRGLLDAHASHDDTKMAETSCKSSAWAAHAMIPGSCCASAASGCLSQLCVKCSLLCEQQTSNACISSGCDHTKAW